MTRTLVIAFALILTWLLPASDAHSGVVVGPSFYATNEAPNRFFLFQPHPTQRTNQYTVAESDFSSLNIGDKITGIGYRFDSSAVNPLPPASFTDFDIQLSKISTLALSLTFADNIGSDVVQVRSGNLNLSLDSSFVGPNPNAFFEIPFDTPYTYTGENVVVTIRYQNGSGFPPNVSATDAVPSSTTGGPQAIVSSGVSSYTAVVAQPTLVNVPVTQFTVQPIPEPSSLAIFGFGAVGMAGICRHRKRKAKANGLTDAVPLLEGR